MNYHLINFLLIGPIKHYYINKTKIKTFKLKIHLKNHLYFKTQLKNKKIPPLAKNYLKKLDR